MNLVTLERQYTFRVSSYLLVCLIYFLNGTENRFSLY